ncbi:MAG TPA: alpha/beta hydrolase [Thermomicrobiales bacterium]|nr:alpha/beta hydrolase [Thermomicrobiales bacterium]
MAAVATRLAAGDTAGGTRDFYDTVASGPGTWDSFSPEGQQAFLNAAPTFLDEARDPEAYALDLDAVAAFRGPALVTHGDQSLPFFAPIARLVAATLPRGELRVLTGAGHVPHATHPDEYAAVITGFADAAAGGLD